MRYESPRLTNSSPDGVNAETRALQLEAERLGALLSYAVLDTAPEPAFDGIAGLAAQIFNVPVALIGFVDASRTWYKSIYGIAAPRAAPRDGSLCSSAIAGTAPYVIEDTTSDSRTRDMADVTGPMQIRFFAAIPLRTSDGFTLGALCVCDSAPHEADPTALGMLSDLAAIVMDELELRLSARRL